MIGATARQARMREVTTATALGPGFIPTVAGFRHLPGAGRLLVGVTEPWLSLWRAGSEEAVHEMAVTLPRPRAVLRLQTLSHTLVVLHERARRVVLTIFQR